MKQFYYELNGQQTGPIAVDELRPLQINGETLIWFEGLSGWTKAKDIPELADYLNKLPPPLPPRQQIKIDNIYDLTYEKETDAISAGVALLITPLFFFELIGVSTFETEKSLHSAQVILALVAIVVRIVITLWVVAIAERQNRNTTGWGFYAFFLPSISLINIGCLRRLKVAGQPSFAEIKKEKKADHRTLEQKKIDDEKFERQGKILNIIIVTMIIGGFAAFLAIMFF